jgi:hypothetical protein
MTKILVGGECQIPYHSPQMWKSFIQYVNGFEPDEVIIIGDFLDCPAPARWNRGTAEEYAGNLQGEINVAKRMLTELRNTFNGYLGFHIGNHEARIDMYARTKAPAFADLDCLTVESLLDFKGFDIEKRKPIHSLGKGTGWISSHGDLGALSKYSGGTAMALARRLGRSVVCGHTHRLGILNESSGLGAATTLSGVESGHMMDVKKAGYIKHGAPNWQAGWAVLEISGSYVAPGLVRVSPSGRFTALGY